MRVFALWTFLAPAFPVQQDPFQDLDRRPGDPPPAQEERGWAWHLLNENFTLKKEIFSQFSYGSEEPHGGDRLVDDVYSRQSLGFEILKKFSTSTATVAAFDVQGRLVRRDHFIETLNDMEGMDHDGWSFEVHNLYADLYNVLNPFLGPDARGDLIGAVNLRAGRFYLPFGLNLQTDTHGTLLQLSNERNFSFERDWYAGFWGSLTEAFNYDAYYLVGSGAAPRFKGQGGLVGLRLSLADRFRYEHGLEAGVAVLYGSRLSEDAVERSPSVAETAGPEDAVSTARAGLDVRWTLPLSPGSLAVTVELSGGRDEADDVLTQLVQIEYLADHRQWGASVQFRRFWQDIGRGALPPGEPVPGTTDASIIGELAWHFRNDPGNAFLHSVRLNVERRLERQSGPDETVLTLQYYLYW